MAREIKTNQSNTSKNLYVIIQILGIVRNTDSECILIGSNKSLVENDKWFLKTGSDWLEEMSIFSGFVIRRAQIKLLTLLLNFGGNFKMVFPELTITRLVE